MTQQEINAIIDLAEAISKRSSGFAARRGAIFDGLIVADELLDVAIKIRSLAPPRAPDEGIPT